MTDLMMSPEKANRVWPMHALLAFALASA